MALIQVLQFSCSICVTIILAILELEYTWAHKSWRAEKLYSDRLWHGESENHTQNIQK